MRTFEEADPACHHKGNAGLRQLQLHFHALKMRPVEHGHLMPWNAFFLVQFLHALRHEHGLFLGRVERGQHGPLLTARTGRQQLLGKLPGIASDGRIGHRKDLGRAPVIRFNLEELRSGMPFGKTDDRGKVGPAPRIDALRIVSHHHDIAMRARQLIDQLSLHGIGVLVFVHKDELKLVLVFGEHLGMRAEHLEGPREQIIEVSRIGVALPLFILLRHPADAFDHVRTGTEALLHNPLQRHPRVHRKTEHAQNHGSLRKLLASGLLDLLHNLRILADHFRHERLRIVGVEDRESGGQSSGRRVATEDAVADTVEGSTPQPACPAWQEGIDPLHHLAGGLVREGQQQNILGSDGILEQIGHPVGQRARLAAARSRQHKRLARRRGHRCQLLRVQFRSKINRGSLGRRFRNSGGLPFQLVDT